MCRVVVLRCLREVCADGQLLVDLFVNYDCDLDSSNLFERLVNGLVKMAQAALPVNADSQQVRCLMRPVGVLLCGPCCCILTHCHKCLQ
jgi:hypothetical protein